MLNAIRSAIITFLFTTVHKNFLLVAVVANMGNLLNYREPKVWVIPRD